MQITTFKVEAILMVLFTFLSIPSHSPQSMQTTVIHLHGEKHCFRKIWPTPSWWFQCNWLHFNQFSTVGSETHGQVFSAEEAQVFAVGAEAEGPEPVSAQELVQSHLCSKNFFLDCLPAGLKLPVPHICCQLCQNYISLFPVRYF